jgi:hypothetical protein
LEFLDFLDSFGSNINMTNSGNQANYSSLLIERMKQNIYENQISKPFNYMQTVINPMSIIPYNVIGKVKCSIITYDYIQNMNSYIDKLLYYRRLCVNDTCNEINSKATSIMKIENIVKVYKIYLDYPYYTTIEIITMFVKNEYQDFINIYRDANNIEQITTKQIRQQFENILFTDKNGYKKEKILDFHSTTIFLHNVIYNSPSSYNTKTKIIEAIKDKNLESSIFTDKMISYITLTTLYRSLYSILNDIVIKN